MVGLYPTIENLIGQKFEWTIADVKSCDSKSYYESPKNRCRVGFLSNKYIPSRSQDFIACISSRITTDIQVVRLYQINYNWFNEPFAVSHSTNEFILRHAWLNLWDKHMTTGRINQVTNVRLTPRTARCYLRPALKDTIPAMLFEGITTTRASR